MAKKRGAAKVTKAAAHPVAKTTRRRDAETTERTHPVRIELTTARHNLLARLIERCGNIVARRIFGC